MKKFNFYALAIAGTLFAACSADKDVAVNDGPKPGEVRPDGYMSLSINLPTSSSSSLRAPNDVFDDGLASEYAVDKVALLLFQGSSESTATLFQVQDCLKSEPFNDNGEPDTDLKDQITTTYKVNAKVSGYIPGNNLYALAVLNYDSYLDIANKQIKSVLVNGATYGLDYNRTKLADINQLAVNYDLDKLIGSEKNSFLMSNAIMSTVKGGADIPLVPNKGDIFQLAQLDPTKIYNTVEKAEANPAGEILVERAVAKATLYYTADKIGSEAQLPIGTVEWVLDNIEPSTYIFRYRGTDDQLAYLGYRSENVDNYRFVGHETTQKTAYGDMGTSKHYYRTYWCVDPQYDETNYTGAYPTMLTERDGFVEAKKTDTEAAALPQYCTENTFNVANQNYANTTRAVIRVTTQAHETFYTINGGQSQYTAEMAQSYFIENIFKNAVVRKAVAENLVTPGTLTIDDTNFDTYFDITYTKDTNTGVYSVATLSLKSGNVCEQEDNSDGKTFKYGTNMSSTLDDAKKTANDEIIVLEYSNGVMYYEARFEHFGQDLAPWNTWELAAGKTAPTGGSTANAYPGNAEQNYLGRYGMVRNNWYEVNVTAFNKLGSPVYPKLDATNYGTPDDDLKDNMTVKIHILAWAKRTQNWSFDF